MILNQGELRKAIYANSYDLSDEELFLSPSMNNYVRTIIESVTGRYKDKVSFSPCWKDDEMTACTNGYTIFANANNSFAKGKNRVERFSIYVAMLLHECGHILYTDFALCNDINKRYKEKKELYPEPECSEFVHLSSALQTELGPTLLNLRDMLDNCLEDGYVDKRVMSAVPGIGKNLKKLSECHCAGMKSFKEMKQEKADDTSIYMNMVLHYAKAGYLKADSDDTNDPVVESVLNVCDDIDKYRDEYDPYKRAKITNKILSCMYVAIKDMLEKQQNKQQENSQNQNNQEGGQQSADQSSSGHGSDGQSQQNNQNQSNDKEKSSNDGKETQNQKPSNESQDGQNNTSNTDAGASSSVSDGPMSPNSLGSAIQSALSGMNNIHNHNKDTHANTQSPLDNQKVNKNPGNDSNDRFDSAKQDSSSILSESALEQAMEKIAHEIAAEKVEKEQEKDINNSLHDDLSQIKEEAKKESDALKKQLSSSGKLSKEEERQIRQRLEATQLTMNTSLSVKRSEKLNKSEKERYEVCLKPYIKRLVRDIKREFDDRQRGGCERGLYSGTKFVPSRLSTPDKKLFARNIMPEDLPDMGVCVMLDTSGSTRGKRIEAEKKTAYMIYSFCKELNIPCAVYGFSTSCNHTTVTSYAEFYSLDNKDMERICAIQSSGCNRDGMALRYCTKRLLNMPCDEKILIVLSDGKPNDSGYGAKEGKLDIQDVLKKYSGKKITYITAAIGDDKELIQNIYCEGLSFKTAASFLDITNLEELPKLLVKILKKKLKAA